MAFRSMVLVGGLLALPGCNKWHSHEEFDTKVLEGRSFRHPREYELEDAKRVAGGYLALLATGGTAGKDRFDPYTACLDPDQAKQPFRFVEGTFIPGWMDVGARLVVELKGGTRLLFCFDSVVVNISRFPCFECPQDKYVSLAALNEMRARCGQPPAKAVGPIAGPLEDQRDLAKVRRCHLSR